MTAVTVAALALAAVAGLGILAIRRRRLVVTVEGDSMRPTYQDGDRLLVRTGPACRPGDVVVFANPHGPEPGPAMLVKRVAATAGDAVPEATRTRIGAGPVPPGRIVVLGDAVLSLDSRNFGYVRADTVVGVVLRELGARREPGVTAGPGA
ncbi:S26 family signal peptidase [Hamadaea tsunoensis]|uniref:S26 family signal peptidase n=1 Tax=Hamadaea tsunoensis TaxID=53368 RepID=UPI00041C7D66|nr:S26 family signal peptidase [Hamadaea tsunoensis]